MRVLVIGLGATGDAVVAWATAAGHEVVVLEDQPGGGAYLDRAQRALDAGAELLVDAAHRGDRGATRPTSTS